MERLEPTKLGPLEPKRGKTLAVIRRIDYTAGSHALQVTVSFLYTKQRVPDITLVIKGYFKDIGVDYRFVSKCLQCL
jgi:hypothetical protein